MAAYLFSVAFLGTLFWMVEHLFGNKQERPWWRPQVWTDLGSGIINALLSNPLNFVVISVLGFLVLVPTGVIPLADLKTGQYRGFGPIGHLPRWPQFILAFLLGEPAEFRQGPLVVDRHHFYEFLDHVVPIVQHALARNAAGVLHVLGDHAAD